MQKAEFLQLCELQEGSMSNPSIVTNKWGEHQQTMANSGGWATSFGKSSVDGILPSRMGFMLVISGKTRE